MTPQTDIPRPTLEAYVSRVRGHTTGLWQAEDGRVYQVLSIANYHSTDLTTYPITVIHEDVLTGRMWTLPLQDFLRLREYTPAINPPATQVH